MYYCNLYSLDSDLISSIGSPQLSSPAGRTSGYMDLSMSGSSSPGDTTNTTNTTNTSSPSTSRDAANSTSNSGRMGGREGLRCFVFQSL